MRSFVPPAPLAAVIFISGATESIAVCRYVIGSLGSEDSGGVPGINGVGVCVFGLGAGLVRRMESIWVRLDWAVAF